MRRPRQSFATAACRELIHGSGTNAALQCTIDLARVALRIDEPTPALRAIVRFHARAAHKRTTKGV